jgi:uncharacterized protein involved in exopolysaccharide biosynthesis
MSAGYTEQGFHDEEEPRFAAATRSMEDSSPDLRHQLTAALQRWWWLPLLGFLVGALSGALAGSRTPATFETQTTIVIGPSPSLTDPRQITDSLDALDRRSVVATFAAIPSSRSVRGLAQKGLRMSEAQMAAYTVDTSVVPDSNVLAVSVSGPDRNRAVQVANEIALQTIGVATGVYPIYSLKVLDSAELPATASEAGGRNWRSPLLGGLMGLLIGLIGVFLLSRSHRQKRQDTERTADAGTAARPR